MSYTPEIRDRLAKALRLMASEHDGEALAAARAAHRIIAGAGLDWDKVLAEPGVPAFLKRPPSFFRVFHPAGLMPPLDPPRDTWRQTLNYLVTSDAGTPQQRAFIASLLRSGQTADSGWRPATYALASTIVRMHADCFGGKAA